MDFHRFVYETIFTFYYYLLCNFLGAYRMQPKTNDYGPKFI